MTDSSQRTQGVMFTLEVEGILDPRWAEWFDETPVVVVPSAAAAGRTTLIITVPDHSALPAALARATGLNLKVVSVRLGGPAGSE